ncbi:MAG: sensor histidine kinase [Actinomycetes bacterium]
MRRQLALLVLATTSLVVLAFLLPLAALIRTGAVSTALDTASAQAQALVPIVGVGSPAEIHAAVNLLGGSAADRVTVYLPGVAPIGDPVPQDSAVALAAAQARALSYPTPQGHVLLQPVLGRAGGAAVIRVLVPGSAMTAGVTRAWMVLGLLGLALLLLAIGLADRLARSMVRPIADLARTAELLETGDLTARTVPAGPREIHEVGVALNRLAARITELLHAEREAVADLSHRLRTPATALRLDAESLRTPDERARLVADVDDLTRTVDALIREARRPVREGVGARTDARAVVAERAAYWSALAEEQHRPAATRLPEAPVVVRVPPEDLAALVDALLGNVFAHTEEGVGYRVALRALPEGGALLEIADSGAGLPGLDVTSRGVSTGGSTGLGLDIARRTAVASGGWLRTTTDGGAVVQVRLGPPDG